MKNNSHWIFRDHLGDKHTIHHLLDHELHPMEHRKKKIRNFFARIIAWFAPKRTWTFTNRDKQIIHHKEQRIRNLFRRAFGKNNV